MELSFDAVLQQWMANMVHDLARYAVFSIAVWFGLWIVLGRILQNRKIRPERPPARQLVSEFLHSIRSVAVFSTCAIVPFVLERSGWLHSHETGTSWGLPWFWTSLILMVLAHDAYFYWVHRGLHAVRQFRRFHRRHHLSHNPSPFTAYSFDVGEAFLMGIFVPLWVILVPTPWPVVGLFVLHQIVRNTIGHSGYEIMPAASNGKPLFDWMTTVTHHDLHHSHARWNFGLYFTWWDRWMGTEHPDYYAHYALATGHAGAFVRDRPTS